jgi:predicted PurR-regulated permease PerM
MAGPHDPDEGTREPTEGDEGTTPFDRSELLFHPDDAPGEDDPHPYGVPGEPISRRAPFYVGFVGGLGVLTALLLGLALQRIGSVLVLILVAFFLAVGLNPVVEWLMHRGLRRPWAVFVVSLGLLGAIAGFVIALVPVLQDQITALIDNVPGYLDDLQRQQWVQDFDAKYDVLDKVKERVQDSGFAESAFGSVYSVGLAVVNALFNGFLIFVLTLYFLSALPTLKQSVYSMAPASRRQRVTYLGDQILRQTGGYVAGVFVVTLCAGVSTFAFLEIIGLGKYAVALALVVMLLDLIPLIGATIGATIVTVIATFSSLGMGIACLIFYIVYQQVENYVIYPRVMRSSVNVPGVLTVVAVLVGGSLMGVIGAMLAIPMAAAALLLIREVFLRKQDAT